MFLLDLLKSAFLVLSLHIARLRMFYIAGVAAAALLLGTFFLVFLLPASGFPSGTILTIEPGTSATRAAYMLKDEHVIASTFVFRVLVKLMPGEHGVLQGKYTFTKPVGVLAVAWNLTHGVSGLPTIRVTFPEGTTVRQMGSTLGDVLPNFSADRFDTIALPAEGYLFPDTYFFLPGTTEIEALDTLRANYRTHIEKYRSAIDESGKLEREILTMASLLEGEGKTLEDKRMIAGILWHRIRIGMPLQVDAAFGYIYGRTGYVPTAADLKENSAYNTYRYKGLPPTPINNPGEISIEAALTPTDSDYLYYLTGTDGKMYYAKTFAEHIQNQKKYLK